MMRHNGFVLDLAFSPAEAVLASIGSEGTLRLWDYTKGEELVALQGPEDQIWALAFSPDGRTLATVEQTGRVVLWDARARRRESPLIDEGPQTMPLAFSADSRTLLTVNENGGVKFWDVATGRELTARGFQVTMAGVYTGDFESIAPVLSPRS